MAAREAERGASQGTEEALHSAQSSALSAGVLEEGGETGTGTIPRLDAAAGPSTPPEAGAVPAGPSTPAEGGTASAAASRELAREKALRTRRPLQLFPCDKLE